MALTACLKSLFWVLRVQCTVAIHYSKRRTTVAREKGAPAEEPAPEDVKKLCADAVRIWGDIAGGLTGPDTEGASEAARKAGKACEVFAQRTPAEASSRWEQAWAWRGSQPKTGEDPSTKTATEFHL